MVLENESDFLVADARLGGFVEFERPLTVEFQTAGGRRIEEAEDVKQGALAATRWTDDRKAIVGDDHQVDGFKYGQLTGSRCVRLGDLLEIDHATLW